MSIKLEDYSNYHTIDTDKIDKIKSIKKALNIVESENSYNCEVYNKLDNIDFELNDGDVVFISNSCNLKKRNVDNYIKNKYTNVTRTLDITKANIIIYVEDFWSDLNINPGIFHEKTGSFLNTSNGYGRHYYHSFIKNLTSLSVNHQNKISNALINTSSNSRGNYYYNRDFDSAEKLKSALYESLDDSIKDEFIETELLNIFSWNNTKKMSQWVKKTINNLDYIHNLINTEGVKFITSNVVINKINKDRDQGKEVLDQENIDKIIELIGSTNKDNIKLGVNLLDKFNKYDLFFRLLPYYYYKFNAQSIGEFNRFFSNDVRFSNYLESSNRYADRRTIKNHMNLLFRLPEDKKNLVFDIMKSFEA